MTLLQIFVGFLILVILGLSCVTFVFASLYKTTLKEFITSSNNLANCNIELEKIIEEKQETEQKLEEEKKRNGIVLSSKISSEVKLGQTAQHLYPVLDACKYPSKAMHFLGNFCDYIVFNLESADPEIVFLEFKTNGAKLNKNQRLIKGLVTKGKVRWEEVTLNKYGINVKQIKNEE